MGEKPEYIFYRMTNAVKVIRKTNKTYFQHTFIQDDLVQGRTLKNFDFDSDYKNKRNVYVTSEEFPESNAQSLANQIDFIFKNEHTPPMLVEDDLSAIIVDSTTSQTEKKSLVSARIGQGQFRKDLLPCGEAAPSRALQPKSC